MQRSLPRRLRYRSRAATQGLGLLGVVVGLAAMAWMPGAVQSGSSLDGSFGDSRDLWVGRDVVRSLPTSGTAWERLADDATGNWGSPDIQDQNSNHDVLTLAGALYAVRTNDTAMRARVVDAIEGAVGTERGGRTLALARNLTGYVLAADLIGYDSPRFHSWVDGVRTADLDGRTLISTHEDRPNNWGTHAGAARIAAARFLGDTADLQRATAVFRGFVGDRSAYTGFNYGDAAWQADPGAPVGINPAGATKQGYVVDGAIVDDVRRCECAVTSPAPRENYQWEAMQGIVTQATLLDAAGQDDVWSWSDAAIRRAVDFLYVQARFPAEGDDGFLTFLIDAHLGTNYSAGSEGRSGKSIGYTGWTHADATATATPSPTTTATTTPTTIPIVTLPATTTPTTTPPTTAPTTTTTPADTSIPSTSVATTVAPVAATNPTTTTVPIVTIPPGPPLRIGAISHTTSARLVAGTATGTHEDTWTRGGGAHIVSEVVSSHRRSSRRYDLAEMQWTLPAVGGQQVLDAVLTVGPDAGDDDTGFSIEWSPNGTDWHPIALVASGTSLDFSTEIGSPSNEVHVRVVDPNRTRRERSPDWVSIDFLQVRSSG